MTVTFRAEPNELSFIVFDYHLECVVEPGRDRRVFATYEQAVAGLRDHHRYCTDELCFPDAPFVVSRTAADDEPFLNVTTTGAVLLLRALGLLPEIGADAVTDAPDDSADRAAMACCPPLEGAHGSADLLARLDLALALCPVDDGIPWHAHPIRPNLVDCGRRPGYLQRRLQELRAIAAYAHSTHRRVSWY